MWGSLIGMHLHYLISLLCLLKNHIPSCAHFNVAVNAIKKDLFLSKNPLFSKNLMGALSFVFKGAHRALRHCVGSCEHSISFLYADEAHKDICNCVLDLLQDLENLRKAQIF